jgi:hypothetical protein
MVDVLERYLEEAGVDAALDVFTVKDVQSKLPGIKHKWVGRLIRTKRHLGQLYNNKETAQEKLLAMAKEAAPYKVSDASLVKTLSSTKTIRDIDNEIKECRLIVDFLERTEKIFSSMTFDIKNLSEIMKLETL